MVRSRVIVSFVFPQLFIDVRGRLIDGRDDGPSGGIGLLPDMNGVGGKTHCALLANAVLIVTPSFGRPALTVWGEFQIGRALISPAEQFLENLQEPY